MAELNPNIILAAEAPKIANPLESASKALSMGNLMQEHQSNQLKLGEQQRQVADSSALRNAFKNNTIADENGNPQVNRQGVMKELMAANPMLAQKQALDFRQMDIDRLNQQHSAAKEILFGIDPTNQNSLNEAFAKAKAMGLPPLEQQLPSNVNDPNFQSQLRNVQIKNLTAEEQLAQQNKDNDFKMKQMENQLQTKKLDVEQAHYNNDKRMKAVEDFNQAVDSARQSPDAQQSLKDILASKKIGEIVSQAPDGDLNKLNPQQTKLAIMEVVKMAGGSVPTEGELESMTPDNLAQRYAGLLQRVTNESQPANAGEFLKQGINYANGIAEVGKQGLTERSNRIADRLKPYLGADQHSMIKKQIAGEFDGVGKKADAGFSKDISDYAEKHGITKQQAAAIKAARTKVAGE